MLQLLLLSGLALAAAAPASYDQRQDGNLNVRADVQNVVLLVALPSKMPVSPDFLDLFMKNAKPDHELQERADVHIMEAFVEPSTPYRVEIGSGERAAEGDARAVEVVIAGRRHGSVDSEDDQEYKLVGATEQCGPGMERDPATLACRAQPDQPPAPPAPPALPVPPAPTDQPAPAVQPEVVAAA